MYQYIRLPFRTALASDMFKKKIDELFSGVPNILALMMTFKLQCLMQTVGIMIQD